MKRIKIKDSMVMNHEVELSFNMLKSNLDYYGNEPKVVAVTSCLDKEGKSFVAYRLAITCANAGKRTLLLMTDYRKTMGNGSNTLVGLAEMLSNNCTLMDALYETDIEKMHIIFAGDKSKDKDISINADRLTILVNGLKKMFDVIIIDTSTIGKTVNDKAVFSQADGAVLVLEPDKVPRKLIKHVRKIIESTGCMLFGMIFNNKDKL